MTQDWVFIAPENYAYTTDELVAIGRAVEAFRDALPKGLEGILVQIDGLKIVLPAGGVKFVRTDELQPVMTINQP